MKTWYREEPEGYYWDSSWKDAKPRTVHRIRKDQVMDFLKHWLPDDKKSHFKIIDAGCGLGEYVAYLSEKGYDVIGVDNSQIALEHAKKYWNGKYKFQFGDILRLDNFPDGYFDMYLSLGVFEHFEDGMGKPLQEANRLLKQGGILVISVPYINFLRRYIKSWREIAEGKVFHQYIYTQEELSVELKKVGFDVIKFNPLSMSWAFYGEYKIFQIIPFGKIISRVLANVAKYFCPWQVAHMILIIAGTPRSR